MTRWRQFIILATTSFLVVTMLAGCSLKKNTALSRQYTAFITRYNIYFNGDEHYKETLKELERSYQDDYSRRLWMHPIEAKADPKAPQPSGNFNRSIEKAQKAIQIRSIKKKPKKQPGKQHDEKYKEWMKRSEYNPFLHNAWMMMGRSQYYNGDFSGGAATFLYVSRHFKWLPDVVTEAKLWEARCYLADDWLYEAEALIVRVKPDQLVNKRIKGLYYFDYADLEIRRHNFDKAVPLLQELLKYSNAKQKMRINFLLGQLLSELGRKHEAYEAFARAGKSAESDYRTKFNARIRQSEVFEGENIEGEVKALKRMTRYDRNKEFLDQIYYAIGNLYLSRRDTTAAVENYIKAVDQSKRNAYDKALANLALGNIYFAQQRYDLAQPRMSEAIPQLPTDFPDLTTLRRRSDVLDELAVYAQQVHMQDSLLALSKLPIEEQMAVCKRLAEEYKKKKKEEEEAARREAARAEASANAPAMPDNNVAGQVNFGNDDSWYFYNQQAVASGKQAFQRQWGARKLEDNWRRRNKQEFSMADFGSADADEENAEPQEEEVPADSIAAQPVDEEQAERERLASVQDPEDPDFYFKNIPQTDAERTTAHDIVQEGLYNMGVILKDKLDDYTAARLEFDKLLSSYPHNVYRPDVYYNLYLMYVRQGDMAEAEKWQKLIVSEFPESPLGQAMASPDYLANLRVMDARQEELYEQTLDAYFDNQNARVHANYEKMKEEFPMSKIMPKFMFLNALAYVTEHKPEEFASGLRELLERYPDTDITPLATSYLKGLAAGRKLNQPATNMRGMLWDTRLITSADSAGVVAEGPMEVTINPDAPQLMVLLYSLDNVSPALLLYEVARHNFATFVVRDFELEQMAFGRLGVLVIKGFNNMRELDFYRKRLLEGSDFKLPAGVRPVVISQENFDKLLKEGRSFDDYFEAVGEKIDMDTHEEVLPPEEYPSPAEMYPTEEELPALGWPTEESAAPDFDRFENSLTPEGSEGLEEGEYDIPVPEAPKPPKSVKAPKLLHSVEAEIYEPEPTPEPEPVVAPKFETKTEPTQVAEPVTTPKPEVKPEPVAAPKKADGKEPPYAPNQLPTKPGVKPKVVVPITPTDVPEGSEGDEED